MLQSGPKVLTECHNPHACVAQVVQGLQNFIIALAKSDHQSAFRYDALPVQTAQGLQARTVLGSGAHHGGQSLDGFDVVPDDVGLRRDDHLQQVGPCVQIGNKKLNYGVGVLCADGLHGCGPMGCSAVGEVVARHGSYDDIPQFHQCDAFGHLSWLLGVGSKGTARFGCAETAAPSADVSQNHECRCPPAPAFGLVGTPAAAANRVQIVLFDDLPHFAPFGSAVESDFQPSGFFQYIYLVIKLRHLSSLFSN